MTTMVFNIDEVTKEIRMVRHVNHARYIFADGQYEVVYRRKNPIKKQLIVIIITLIIQLNDRCIEEPQLLTPITKNYTSARKVQTFKRPYLLKRLITNEYFTFEGQTYLKYHGFCRNHQTPYIKVTIFYTKRVQGGGGGGGGAKVSDWDIVIPGSKNIWSWILNGIKNDSSLNDFQKKNQRVDAKLLSL